MKQFFTIRSTTHDAAKPGIYSTVQIPTRRSGDSGLDRILCRIIIFLLCLSTAGTAQAADRPIIREMLVSKEGNGARIEIRANQPLLHRSYLMSGLEKWVVDLPGARTTSGRDESKKLRTAPLERMTIHHKEVNGDLFTRIGLDFKGEVNFSIKQDPLDKGHLVIIMTPLKAASKNVSTDQLFRP